MFTLELIKYHISLGAIDNIYWLMIQVMSKIVSRDLPDEEVVNLRLKKAADWPSRDDGFEQPPSSPGSDEGPPINDRSIPALLNRNRAYIDGKTLVSSAPDDEGNVKLLSHTLSKLDSRFIHPVPIHQMKTVKSLDDLAVSLEAPENWEEIFNNVFSRSVLLRKIFYSFVNLPENTREREIEDIFITLVVCLCTLLDSNIKVRQKEPIAIGGLLAHKKFDIMGEADPIFVTPSGSVAFGTEIKTFETFHHDDPWYQESRAAQTLTLVYALRCPVFLFTQRAWKMFLENDERDAILTFPVGTENYSNRTPDAIAAAHLHQKAPVDESFLKAIAICILASDEEITPVRNQTQAASIMNESAFGDVRTGDRKRRKRASNDTQSSFIGPSETGEYERTFLRRISEEQKQQFKELLNAFEIEKSLETSGKLLDLNEVSNEIRIGTRA